MALASGSRVESGPMRLFLPLVQAAEAKCIELAMAACIAKLRSKVCRPCFLRIDYARADRRFTSLALSGYHFPRSRFQHLELDFSQSPQAEWAACAASAL